MLKTLIKIRLIALGRSMFNRMGRGGRERGKAGKALMALLLVYCFAVVMLSLGMLFSQIVAAFVGVGLGWLYFAVSGAMALVLSFIGSVFAARSMLFDANDNELLLSMPVPPRYILASRIIALLALEMIYNLFVMLPAAVVYIVRVGYFPGLIAVFVVGILLLTLLACALASLFGWLAALVLARVSRKNLVSTVLTFALLGAYMYFYMNMNRLISSLLANGADVAAALRRALPPLYHFGMAVSERSAVQLLLLAMWCVLPFAALYLLLSRSFIKVATAGKGSARVKYRERALRVSSPRAALLRKELRRFFGTPMYMINLGLGPLLLLIGSGYIAVRGAEVRETLFLLEREVSVAGLTAALLCAVMMFMTSTACITAPSISLEGKRLWILRSVPVSARQVLFAKLSANLVVALPPIFIAAAVCTAALGLGWQDALLLLFVPAAFQVFVAALGLAVNLRMPRFDWINETVVIKQSGSIIVTMLVSMALVGVSALATVVLSANGVLGLRALLLCCGVLYAALAAAGCVWLMRRGERIFDRL
ncbi:MAG: hypothetical protein IJU78_08470 [Clostridia bacterium]|nr:hypothetical protein [Clostridia bacterium]